MIALRTESVVRRRGKLTPFSPELLYKEDTERDSMLNSSCETMPALSGGRRRG